MIMPPNELNDEAVLKREQFEAHLATEFPGYKFEVVDLRMLRPVGHGQKVMFGDGSQFTVMPMMGSTGEGKRTFEMPDRELIAEIMRACHKFDFQNSKRYVA
jgi:hypothetical protein